MPALGGCCPREMPSTTPRFEMHPAVANPAERKRSTAHPAEPTGCHTCRGVPGSRVLVLRVFARGRKHIRPRNGHPRALGSAGPENNRGRQKAKDSAHAFSPCAAKSGPEKTTQ